ncbi:uncharacterized protein LOC119389075 [Rhipicephalus sanguineus]|uniref:uncharacterized protein LOC119389075 n=1 Tax=Rhipicephalus sanguineus TaxID=34632 RepID=UPI001894DBAA|nr:uncharacterized protein LOC119389075 [Rhipicephalus sanguineus]
MKASPFCLFLLLAVAVIGTPSRRDGVLHPSGRGSTEIANAKAPEFMDNGTSGPAAQRGGTEPALQGDREGSRGVDQMRPSMPSPSYSSHDGQRSKEEQGTPRARSSSALWNGGRNNGQESNFRRQQPDFEVPSVSSEDTESKTNEQPQLTDNGRIEKAAKRGLGIRAPSRDSGSVGSAETHGTGLGRRMSLGRAGGGSQNDEQDPESQLRGHSNRDGKQRLEVNRESQVRFGNLFGAHWLMNSTRTWTTPTRPTGAMRYLTTD